jgi:hypothetical protein
MTTAQETFEMMTAKMPEDVAGVIYDMMTVKPPLADGFGDLNAKHIFVIPAEKEEPYFYKINDTYNYKTVQTIVGGFFESIPLCYNLGDYHYTIYIHEDGRRMNLPLNEWLFKRTGLCVFGNAVVVRLDDEGETVDYIGVDWKQVERDLIVRGHSGHFLSAVKRRDAQVIDQLCDRELVKIEEGRLVRV